MEATEKKKAQHYLDLPYTTAVNAEQQENGTTRFLARIVEFPECSADGATPEEAIRQIETTKAGCIERYLSDGKPVPLPLRMRKFSGKFQVRISPSLHEAIAMRAELDGISLLLGRKKHWRSSSRTRRTPRAGRRSG
jgi:predicted RNase H-like HicB family nuclease